MQTTSSKQRQIDYFLLCIYLFFSIVAIFAIYYARTFPIFTMSNDIGAAKFPLFFSYALLGLCSIGIIRTLVNKKIPSAVATAPLSIKKSIIAILLNVLVIYLISLIGFHLATFLFSSALMWLLGVRNKVRIMLYSTGLVMMIYLIFQVLLNVPLPMGMWFE